MLGLHAWPIHIDKNKVGALPDGYAVGLGENKLGAVFRGGKKHIFCLYDGTSLLIEVREKGGQIHLPENVERIVRGGPVGAQADAHSLLLKFRERGNSASQFEV